MATRLKALVTGLVAATLVVAGCQPADDAATAPDEAVDQPAEAAPAEPAAAGEVAAPKAANVEPSATLPQPTATAVDHFTPPFPDRSDPFDPPKRARGMARRSEDSGETVELKGFVNVDGQRVVLDIDGIISPLPEGGERYGVRVISIQPPSVVLQRGRSRWTASLE